MKRTETGFSLLTITAAISIAAVMAVGGFGITNWLQQKAFSIEGTQNVHQLEVALNAFYHTHCREPSFPVVSTAILISEGFLPSSYTGRTQWTTNLAPAVDVVSTPHRLLISASVNVNEDPSWVQATLGAHSVLSSVLTWQFSPISKSPYESSRAGRFQRYYGASC